MVRVHPFKFATASGETIVAALGRVHMGGQALARCGRFTRDGSRIGSCEQCARFTLQWMTEADDYPALKDVLPRLPQRAHSKT